VREFCETAFRSVGLDHRNFVVQDPRFYRPAEVDMLVADASKVHQTMGWEPKVSFAGLIDMMVNADLDRLRKELS
jgi:GDPmannose 4,6-dehydratase